MRFLALTLLVLSTLTSISVYGQVIDDVQSTNEETPVTFSITANDSDPDGIDEASVDLDPSTLGQETDRNVAEGSFAVDPLGELTFTPAADFSGDVTIRR